MITMLGSGRDMAKGLPVYCWRKGRRGRRALGSESFMDLLQDLNVLTDVANMYSACQVAMR